MVDVVVENLSHGEGGLLLAALALGALLLADTEVDKDGASLVHGLDEELVVAEALEEGEKERARQGRRRRVCGEKEEGKLPC